MTTETPRTRDGLAAVVAWQAVVVCAALGSAACQAGVAAHASMWPEADRLFHGDPRWIGGDGAYSVDLGHDRVLWLFGDSFVALTPDRVRRASRMVRNSIALQTGQDPARAFLRFVWGGGVGQPESFLPEEGETWFWPMHGLRLADRLVLFFQRVRTRDGGGTFGFEAVGWKAVAVEDPDADPAVWTTRDLAGPAFDGGVQLGHAVVRVGDFVYLYGIKGSFHSVYLARLPASALAAGDLSAPAWWDGRGFAEGEVEPAAVIDICAPELSVHYEPRLSQFALVASGGFGSTTLTVRTAPAPEGPWSEPRDLVRPPESFTAGAFVYAGKAHPELGGADLVATYVPSSFDTPPEAEEEQLYYPRFVRIVFP